MKKQLLTAAVAAAVALPMIAQAGIYGRTDGVLRYNDSGATDNWEVGVDKMRWGIVGSEDLGNGMKALYHYEWAMRNFGTAGSTFENENTRLAYVGLEGGFGKLTIGRNWWPSYFAVWNKTDTGDAHATGGSQSNFSGNRIGRQIAYTSPNFSGFTFSAAAVLSNESNADAEDGIDVYEIVGNYKNGPLQIGATFRNDQRDNLGITGSLGDIDLNDLAAATNTTDVIAAITDVISAGCGTSCADTDIWGIGGSYAFGDLTVEANYGNSEPDTGPETDAFGIGATFTMGPNQIHGGYRNNEVDGGREIDDWYIGFRHFMSKETRVFVEYRNTDDDSKADEVDMFAIGMRKDWKL